MNITRLKRYAQRARRDFIAAVTARAADFGLTVSGAAPLTDSGDTVFIAGRPFPASVVAPRRRLIEQIGQRGFGRVMDVMAYTWFNRFVAIRYMEFHGLLGHGMRVLTPPL